MTTFDGLPQNDQRRLEQAAEWWHRMQSDASVELSADFLRWVSNSSNARALEAVENTMGALQDFSATPKVLDFRRSALTRLRNAGMKRWLPLRAMTRIAAVALVVAIAAGGAWYWQSQQPTKYSTDIGDRRVVALTDGSRISLNSDSEVGVRYTQTGRSITLDRGRARFDVAHDVTRPFMVTAGNKTVVAVGTSFDVERLGSTVLVTLIQGHVLIKDAAAVSPLALVGPAPKPKAAISLIAGEQFVAIRDAKPVVSNANLDAATAWEAGHLVFRGEPLGAAVERVNRYTDHPIVVDSTAAAVRISGVFNAGDIGSFVSAITGYFPVQATTDADNTITLQKKS